MKRILIVAIAAIASLTVVAGAGAALEPGVYDPGKTGCVKATYAKGTLHLEKNCPTATDAAAGAEVTGVAGQTFQSAEFTLKSATQCQGGSPRFIVVTSTGLYHLGCNNVTPTTNANGTVTYLITPETLAAAGQPVPTGAISFVSLMIDVQGTADVSKIAFNGVAEKLVKTKPDFTAPCKNGAWKTFTNPKFKNQGQCVKFVMHARNAARKAARG